MSPARNIPCSETSQRRNARIWDVYLRTYLDTQDEALIRKAERQITTIAAARTLFAAVFIPGMLSPDRIESMKRTALDYVDGGMETLCF